MAHSAGIGGVELSHPDKLLFPKDGFTKADLAEYYATVAAFMLPHLADRPITMVRCPGGIGKRCFFQKHPSEGMAESTERIAIAEETGTRDYLIVRDPRDLLELVQFETIEIHGWSATRRDLERPDRVIFDLDPGPGVEWSVVVFALAIAISLHCGSPVGQLRQAAFCSERMNAWVMELT